MKLLPLLFIPLLFASASARPLLRTSQAYRERGIQEQSAKHYQLAVEDFSAAIKLNPKEGQNYRGRAISYQSLSTESYPFPGSPNEAQRKKKSRKYLDLSLADANQGCLLAPKAWSSPFLCGMSYTDIAVADNSAKMGNLAVANFTRAIQLAPNEPLPYAQRAGTYRWMNQIKLAEADEKKAISLQKAPK